MNQVVSKVFQELSHQEWVCCMLLDIETTEEALSTYLTDVGIKGVVCKKLKAKNGKQFHTAAFYVSCCCESKELFYNESCWPEGVELRDWIFYYN